MTRLPSRAIFIAHSEGVATDDKGGAGAVVQCRLAQSVMRKT